jgi:NADPH:quinone reductase-like Zn-dependent oxidoreductase
VTPVIERTNRLAEVPDALRHLAAGHAAGKLVVVP